MPRYFRVSAVHLDDKERNGKNNFKGEEMLGAGGIEWGGCILVG